MTCAYEMSRRVHGPLPLGSSGVLSDRLGTHFASHYNMNMWIPLLNPVHGVALLMKPSYSRRCLALDGIARSVQAGILAHLRMARGAGNKW